MAEVCHEEWVAWSKSISTEFNNIIDVLKKDIEFYEEKGEENKEAIELLEKLELRLERWADLWVPYEELSEEMKDMDREYAIRMFDIAKEGLKE